MLNAVNVTAVSLWRYTSATHELTPGDASSAVLTTVDGQMFAIFVIALAAAEAAVGLALIISVYRQRRTVSLDMLDMLKG
jgi:NADH-quinone oxidoreductase subunit K